MTPLGSSAGVPGEKKRNGHPVGMSLPNFNKRSFTLTEELFNFQLRVKFQAIKQREWRSTAFLLTPYLWPAKAALRLNTWRTEEVDHCLQ